jgi:hypothetical protein
MLRVSLVTAALLALCIPAIADTVTVSQTLTYADNQGNDANGPCFVVREWTMDHDPYHRGMWEDWGWTHDMTNLMPTGATSIVSATLKIRTWDTPSAAVNGIYAVRRSGGTLTAFMPEGREFGDPMYLRTTFLGNLGTTDPYEFLSTTLTITDTSVLNELFTYKTLPIFMNIDEAGTGYRVTVVYAMLTVTYRVPNKTPTPSLPVYRFWSSRLHQHFFTAKEGEKNKLRTAQYASTWSYEGIAFYTFPDDRHNDANTTPVVLPVYRFWRPETGTHFYTIKEGEKDKLMAWCTESQAKSTGIPATWIYEGIAFYAHPKGYQPGDSDPVYRFWSSTLVDHFFTASYTEVQNYRRDDRWLDEGIAWYAYAP